MGEKNSLQSVENALRLIDLLDQAEKEMGVTEIGRALSIGKSTTHRLLATMHNRQFIAKNKKTGKYSLGFKIISMANNIIEKSDIVLLTRPYRIKLVEETGETCHLFAFNRQHVSLVGRLQGRYDNRGQYGEGTTFPAQVTAGGKAFLAYLPEEHKQEFFEKVQLKAYTPFTILDKTELMDELMEGRKRGYFEDQQEYEEGRICYAVPIFNKEQKVIAAISLTGSATRMNEEGEVLIPQLKKAGQECTDVCQNLYSFGF